MQSLVTASRQEEIFLNNAGVTKDQAELFLSYATSQIEGLIRDIRLVLSKVSDYHVRYEYLARIEALELAQSKLSIEQLVKELEIPTQKEIDFNVR